MKIFEGKKKAIITVDIDGKSKSISIPSDYFPLPNDEYKVFTSKNTAICDDDKIKEIFDNSAYKIADCFNNADLLFQKLKSENIDAKLWAGWLFIEEDYPLFHCWVTVDNHLLDLTNDFAKRNSFLTRNLKNINDINEARQLVVQFDNECRKRKITNSQRCSPFGQIYNSLHTYVGSQCGSGAEAKQLINSLIAKHPNHKSRIPCPNNSNLTITQQMQKDAIEKQE